MPASYLTERGIRSHDSPDIPGSPATRSSRPVIAALALAVTALFALAVPALAQDPSAQRSAARAGADSAAAHRPLGARSAGQGQGRHHDARGRRDAGAAGELERHHRRDAHGDTKIESPSGLLNIDQKRQDVSLLAPGLFVEIHGVGGDHGNLVATRVTFSKRAVKVQNSIAAGEVDLREKQAETAAPTQANLNAINAATRARARFHRRDDERIANLDKYVVKDEGTIYFAQRQLRADRRVEAGDRQARRAGHRG